MLIIDIQDVGVRARRDGNTLLESPAFINLRGRHAQIGLDAQAVSKLDPTRTESQFWDRFGRTGLTASYRAAATQADLAYLHLESIWERLERPNDPLLLTVPADFSDEQVSLLLGVCQRLEMPVRAVLAKPVALAPRPLPGRTIFCLDLFLHKAVLARLDQSQWLSMDRIATNRDVGLARLRETWSHAAARRFVSETRFDPMHDAGTEQSLYDALLEWEQLGQDWDSIAIKIDNGDKQFASTIDTERLTRAGEVVLRRLEAFVAQEVSGANAPVLLLPQSLARLPGISAALSQVPQLELIACELTEKNHGLSRLYLDRQQEDEGVAFIDKLPWFGQPDLVKHADQIQDGGGRKPTHVLHGATAYPIGADGLWVGSDVAPPGVNLSQYGDVLAPKHLRLSLKGDTIVLENASGRPLKVNQQSVEDAVNVKAGDRVQLAPTLELMLIAVEMAHGTQEA